MASTSAGAKKPAMPTGGIATFSVVVARRGNAPASAPAEMAHGQRKAVQGRELSRGLRESLQPLDRP